MGLIPGRIALGWVRPEIQVIARFPCARSPGFRAAGALGGLLWGFVLDLGLIGVGARDP